MTLMNRIHNSSNPAQGDHKKVLCVCSAGLLRSPTAAVVLSQAPFNFNTRAAGAEESYALVPVDSVLLTWADEVVCMTKEHAATLQHRFGNGIPTARLIVLDIPDNFMYRDPELMGLIAERYKAATT